MKETAYSYPRAGPRGSPAAAGAIEALLADLIDLGLSPASIGPTLVQGYIQLYRRLPDELPGIEKSQIPALYALLGTGTPPLKMAKEDAAYQDKPHPSGQHCDNCSSAYRNVVTNDIVCSQVEGEVSSESWCRLWNTERL